MVKYFASLAALSFLLYSCGVNKPETPIDDSLTNDSSVSQDRISLMDMADDNGIISLPGIDKSIFGDQLDAQGYPIKSEISSTGPYYREQTKTLNSSNFNYIEYSLNVPRAWITKNYVPNIYVGGDTAIGSGAIDVGVASDDNIKYSDGSPTWSPFINVGGGSVTYIPTITADFPANYKYRLANSQPVRFRMWIPGDKKIHLGVTGNWIYNTNQGVKNLIGKEAEYVINAPVSWNSKSFDFGFKVMTSIGIRLLPAKSDFTKYSTNDPLNLKDGAPLLQGVSYSNISIGKTDGKGVLDPKSLLSFSNYLSTAGTSKPYASPPEMVKPVSGDSAEIKIRVISKLEITPADPLIVKVKPGESKYGDLKITNIGVKDSLLYFNYKPELLDPLYGFLKPQESALFSYNFTCLTAGQTKKSYAIFYSENETTSKNLILAGFPLQNPSGLPDSANKIGGILFKKITREVIFDCVGKQRFRINPTDLYAPLQRIASKQVQLIVEPLAGSTQPIVGGYEIAAGVLTPPPVTPAAANITTQSIVVSPKIDPSVLVAQTAANTLNVTATCGDVVENKTFTYAITDPTGNTDPTDYTVTLHCVGPKMTAPTPNPLSISANVGSTATGSFSFGNCPGGTANDCAPLNFTVSGSTGLNVSSSVSPLAIGGTATVNVSYPCTINGIFPATATVSSNDPSRLSTDIPVTVKCGGPKLSGPTPSPLELSTLLGTPVSGTVTISNTGFSPLTYQLSGYASWLAVTSPLSGSIDPGGTVTLALTANCPVPAASQPLGMTAMQVNKTGDVVRLPYAAQAPIQPLLVGPPPTTVPPVRYTTSVLYTTNADPSSATGVVNLNCTQPKLREANTSYRQWAALPGHTVQDRLPIHNDGSSPLTYSLTNLPSWLSVVSNQTGTIPVGGTVSPVLQGLCPPNVASVHSTFTLQSDDPLAKSVQGDVLLSCRLLFTGFDVNAAVTGEPAGTPTGFDTFASASVPIYGMTGRALAVDSSGNLFGVSGDTLVMVPADQITSPGNAQAVSVTSQGLRSPRAMAFDQHGNLWVANNSDTDEQPTVQGTYYMSSSVVVFPAGSLAPGSGAVPITVISSQSAYGLMQYPQFGNPDNRPYLVRASAIAIGPDDHVWISDDRIPRNTYMDFGPLGLGGAGNPRPLTADRFAPLAGGGLTIDRQGALWVGTQYSAFRNSLPSLGLNVYPVNPTALAFDQEGNLWVSDCGGASEVSAINIVDQGGQPRSRVMPALTSGIPGCLASLAFDPPAPR